MPAFAGFVSSMTVPTREHRENGLGCLWSMIKLLTKEQQLVVAEEPGLLAAVEPFLRGWDKVDTALNLLNELANWEGGEVTDTTEKCCTAVFDSPCFSCVKDMAATSTRILVKRKAWLVIRKVTCAEGGRRKAMFDSAGMEELLQAGLESRDDKIVQSATHTVSNLCCSAEVAYALLDSHPGLVKALVKTFSTSGVCFKFKSK